VCAKYKKSLYYKLLRYFFKQKPENANHIITIDALFLSTQKTTCLHPDHDTTRFTGCITAGDYVLHACTKMMQKYETL
jgi:hypothetical protein